MEKSFFEKVFKVAQSIPMGKVTSYGAIARFIGSPQSARMVGWALNKSEFHQDVLDHLYFLPTIIFEFFHYHTEFHL